MGVDVMAQIKEGSIVKKLVGDEVIATIVDVSTKVDKVTGKSLVLNTEIAKIHASGSDDQDLSGLAEKSTIIASNLLAANWTGSDAPFSYSLVVSGVTATSNQELLPSITITIDELNALQSANIIDGGQTTNTIILKAFATKPEINVPIRILKRGD